MDDPYFVGKHTTGSGFRRVSATCLHNLAGHSAPPRSHLVSLPSSLLPFVPSLHACLPPQAPLSLSRGSTGCKPSSSPQTETGLCSLREYQPRSVALPRFPAFNSAGFVGPVRSLGFAPMHRSFSGGGSEVGADESLARWQRELEEAGEDFARSSGLPSLCVHVFVAALSFQERNLDPFEFYLGLAPRLHWWMEHFCLAPHPGDEKLFHVTGSRMCGRGLSRRVTKV